MSAQARRRVQSIEVGFRVLRVLRKADGLLPLREIAQRADMPPSKVHLYLVSFIREKMAYQDAETGFYGLGSFAIQLGLSAIRQIPVVSVATPFLARLRDQTDCAIYLSLWGDSGPCIVSKADGNQQGAFTIKEGSILPAQFSATGNIFLAHLPHEETQPILERERAATVDRKNLTESEIKSIISQVRRDGFISTTGKVNTNFAGIAAPILKPSGNIAATLTLLGSTDYVINERRDGFSKLVVEAASEISERISLVQG